jgi:hypothetical protein
MMRRTALFYLRNVSARLFSNLCKVLDVHTLLLLQVLDAVPHSELLRLVSQILIRYRFHFALLLVLSEPDVLESLVDVEAEVLLVVVVLSLLRNELLLCLLCLGRDPH